MRIQHNIMAMAAYRNYTNNVSAMQKNLEKLSSGYKINRAGDDAAGLAISEKMRAQITGLETAQKNAKDGISLVQTAEGALTEVHDMLNRMVELATQSANGTYDNDTDRAQLQKEMDQLLEEIDRIADSSNFNGIPLLDGSMEGTEPEMTNVTMTPIADTVTSGKAATTGVYTVDISQVKFDSEVTGASVTFSIKVGGATVATVAVSSATAFSVTGGQFQAVAGSATSIGGVTFNVSVSGGKITLTMAEVPTSDFDDAMDVVVAVDGDTHFAGGDESGDNANTENNTGYGLSVTVEREAVAASDKKYAQGSFDLASLNIKDGTTLKIGDTTYTFAVGADSAYSKAKNVIDLTDMETVDAKVAGRRLSTAAASNKMFIVSTPNDDGTIHLTEKEGAGIDYSKNNLIGATSSDTKDHVAAAWNGLVQTGNAADSGSGGLMLQIGDTKDSYNQLRVSIKDCHTSALGIEGLSISDQTSAQNAIDTIKNAINYVSDVRGTLGATQNRLEHTINNLSVMTENIQDAESTIRDTDVAEEMMSYTKNNILIQSAQAMLAQANQVPQGVLQLLQ